MRRLPLVLLAAALLVPAPAVAQEPLVTEDSCRAQGGPESLCVGFEKLGERASAECRRLGVLDDATCWSRVGRRVVRAEIAAYQDSHTHRALAFQQRLGDAVPFANAPWVGTHNSYNSSAELPTLSHTDSNQQLTPVQQLDLDVRSLELDVHWMPSPRGAGLAPVVCHGQGNVGCTSERLLADHLAEIRGWLDAHPEDVLLLYLEDQIDDAAGYEATAAVVESRLGELLHRPSGPGCTDLPLDLTREAVRSAGKQVVVVGDCGQGAWQGVSHAWPSSIRAEGRPVGYTAANCGGISPADAEAKIVRFFEDSTFLAPMAARSGQTSTDEELTPETVRAMVACGVDLTGFDQLLPGDGRLEALVWSWAEGQPSAAAGACAVQRGDGRWASAACEEARRPACGADGTFEVLGTPVSRDEAAAACAARGASLALPRTGRDNARLSALHSDEVWLAL